MNDYNLWFLLLPGVAVVIMVVASRADSQDQGRRLSLWGGSAADGVRRDPAGHDRAGLNLACGVPG